MNYYINRNKDALSLARAESSLSLSAKAVDSKLKVGKRKEKKKIEHLKVSHGTYSATGLVNINLKNSKGHPF